MIYRSIHHLYEKQSHARTLPVVSFSRAFLNNLWTALNTIITIKPGTSANAGPHYQKLYARVTHIWGNRKGQPNRSAMRGPHLERTASLITVPPASGKFFFFFFFFRRPRTWTKVSAMAGRQILNRAEVQWPCQATPEEGTPVRQNRPGIEPGPQTLPA